MGNTKYDPEKKSTENNYLSKLENEAKYFPVGYNQLSLEKKISLLEKLNFPKGKIGGTYSPPQSNEEGEISYESTFSSRKVPPNKRFW